MSGLNAEGTFSNYLDTLIGQRGELTELPDEMRVACHEISLTRALFLRAEKPR